MEKNKTADGPAEKDHSKNQGPKSSADQPMWDEKKEMRNDKANKMMLAGAVVTGCIAGPYMWYACQINVFANSDPDKPDGFDFPTYSNFWLTACSAILLSFVKSANQKLIRPSIVDWVKPIGKDGKPITAEEREAALEKLSDQVYYLTFYICSVITGFYLFKDQEWWPWYMGGHGTLEASFVNIPFYAVDPAVRNYGLFLYGFQV